LEGVKFFDEENNLLSCRFAKTQERRLFSSFMLFKRKKSNLYRAARAGTNN